MRRIQTIFGAALLSLPISGCASSEGSGDGSPEEPADVTGDPPCGDDPALQPERCVDAQGAVRCKVDTGFPGDELALCEMDPEDGIVIHFGPEDYTNPDEVALYVLEGGGEDEFCLYRNTPNTTERFFNAYHGRMRPNSHHLIVTMPERHHPDDVAPWKCGPQVLDRWLFGSQDPQIDVGVGSDPALPRPGDPDYGLAHDIPPNQTLLLDFHNVNGTGEPELREAWASLEFVDASEVEVRADLLAFYQLGISIPPLGRSTTSRLRCEPPASAAGQQEPVYAAMLTGHAHQRLTRFSVFHEKADGSQVLVYETRDWAEPGNALYRDGIQNPKVPMTSGQRWGATSGYLKVLPGEALSFECEFQNDLEKVVGFGDTSQDEMCNVFGTYFPSAGGMWNCFGS